MRKSYKELLKNTGLLTISSFSSKILVFLLVPLYTSVLSTEDYGFYDLVYTSIQLVFPLITADIISAVMRFCMDKQSNQDEVIKNGLQLWFYSTIVVAGIVLLNVPLKLIDYIGGYEIYIVFFYITYSLHQLLIQTTKGLEKIKALAVGGVIGTLTVVILNVLFLVVFKIGLKGFFLATIIGELIPTIYMCWATNIKKYIKLRANSALLKRMILYSFPLVVNTIGWWVNNNIDKYIITWLCGLGINGLLSVAYKVPNILTVIGGIFLQAWQISAVKEYDDKENGTFYNTIYRYYNLALVLATGTLIIFTKLIAMIMFQKEFIDAWIFVPFLLISCFFTQIASYYGPILSAQMNSKAMAVSSIVGIVLNITLNICLTLLIGYVGIAIATAISSFAIYLIRKLYVNKVIKINEGYKTYISWVILILLALEITLSVNILVPICTFIIMILIYIKDSIHVCTMFFNRFVHKR